MELELFFNSKSLASIPKLKVWYIQIYNIGTHTRKNHLKQLTQSEWFRCKLRLVHPKLAHNSSQTKWCA